MKESGRMGPDYPLSRLSGSSRRGGRCSYSNFSGSGSPKGAPLDLYSNRNWRGSDSGTQFSFRDNRVDTDESEITFMNNNTGNVQLRTEKICDNITSTLSEGPERGEPLHGSGILLFKTLENKVEDFDGTSYSQVNPGEVSKSGSGPGMERRKSMSTVGKSSSTQGGTKGTEGGGSVLRYALHLRFMCPPLRYQGKEKSVSSTPPCGVKGAEIEDERRFYIYGDLRVVFPQRHSDADEGKVCCLNHFCHIACTIC